MYNLYACEDADVTLKLKNVLEKELKENDAERLFYDIEMPLVPVLVNIERNGVFAGHGSTATIIRSFSPPRWSKSKKRFTNWLVRPFNIASPKQVGEVFV